MRALFAAMVTVTLLLSVGCTSYPRYRTGSAEMPAQATNRKIDFSTGEHVRLGLIIESYLGKPYAGSSQYDPGIDCSLFTKEVYRRYNRTDLPRKSADQAAVGKKVARNVLRYGDLVFFKTVGSQEFRTSGSTLDTTGSPTRRARTASLYPA